MQPSHPRPQARDPADRLLTVPNVLSLLRLAGIPLFLWLLLGPQYDLLAVLVLALSGLTDWLDGKLA
ncbi:MAG: CDP-alcohol phosphatidyltransferase family protein, partial [Pseudonocardiaceae bacterium]